MGQSDVLTRVLFHSMAPMKSMKSMKSMKAAKKAMGKSVIAATIAEELEMKPKEVSTIIESLVAVGTSEVKKSGIFTIPGLCRIKTCVKPATKAGKREIFGKVVKVKAKPARTVVKAFAVAALKSQF